MRIATLQDADEICEIMLTTGLGPGTGIRENAFVEAMTPANVRASFERMRWLMWDGGLFLVIPVTLTTYEVHIAVLEGFRGKQALEATQAAMNLIFTRTPCVLLVGRTPLANKGACRFALMAGFHKIRETEHAQLASLCFFDWLASRADPHFALTQCEEWGESEKSAASRAMLEWITRGESLCPQQSR